MEFWQFVSKQNIVDRAISVTLGNAFTAIIVALFSFVIYPVVDTYLGKWTDGYHVFRPRDKTNYATKAEAKAAGEHIIDYGQFLKSVLNLITQLGSIYLLIRMYELSVAHATPNLFRRLSLVTKNLPT